MNDINIIWLFVGIILWTSLVVLITAKVASEYKRPIHEVTEVKFIERYSHEIQVFKRDFIIRGDEFFRHGNIPQHIIVDREIKNTIMELFRSIPIEMIDISEQEDFIRGDMKYSVRIKILPPKDIPKGYKTKIGDTTKLKA